METQNNLDSIGPLMFARKLALFIQALQFSITWRREDSQNRAGSQDRKRNII